MSLLHEHPRLDEPTSQAEPAPLLRRSYPARPDSVPVVRREVAAQATYRGVRGERLHALRLAVSEAATNAVRHAYPGSPGKIHVTAGGVDGEFFVLIGDDGCGIHAGPDSDGLGLGLALMSELSDQLVIVERASGGTEVRLRFEVLPGERRLHPRGSVRSATRPATSSFSTTT